MVSVREAFDNLGFVLNADETVCIGTLTNSGGFIQQSIEAAGDEPVGTNRYYSTGTFKLGTDFGKRGSRSGENVKRILEMPFDFDLKDFLNVDKAELIVLDDDELDAYLDTLTATVESRFAAMRLPIHRLDYTGYGISAHVELPPHEKVAVEHLRKLHAGIVTRINQEFGGTLADAQVKDAGSRVMRLVPCENVFIDLKTGEVAPPRQSRTVYRKSAFVDQTVLEAAAKEIVWKASGRAAFREGGKLTPEDMSDIVDAYAPHHQSGVKHFMGLAIAGQLGKAGVSEEQAIEIVERISAGDNKPWDRVKAVHDTYEKLRAGTDVTGYYVLKTIVPDDSIATVSTILEKIAPKGPTLIFSRERDQSPQEDKISFFRPTLPPDDAFYGWHGRWRDLVAPTTTAADAFHLAASTTLQAATMGRRISTTYAGTRIFPNQYAIVVGPTGNSFKDTAYNRTMDMIQHARAIDPTTIRNQSFKSYQDLASRESMVRMFTSTNNIYLFSSEIMALLKNATREATSTLLDGLIYVWDSPPSIQNNSIRAKSDEEDEARNPTLNIYGGIQPGRLAKAMTEDMIISGLGNRAAFFMGVAKGKMSRPPKIDKLASGEMYLELRNRINQDYVDGQELELSADACERWDAWFDAFQEEEDELLNDMKVRHGVMIHKWALLFAVSDGAQEIDYPHMHAAIALCDWMWDCIARMMPGWGVSDDRKIEERILAVLDQRQPITKRDLNRYVRGKWTAREFASVFRAMKENHQIAVSVDERYVALNEYAFQSKEGAA